MKLFGIFDKNNNYKLLRYSTDSQNNPPYISFDINTKNSFIVEEVCIPDIDYSETNIGRHYNISTNSFE
jgi:hypothetical protein